MKRCGIIGGVGPSATVQLMQYIIRDTPTARDQDHIRLIVDNHPQIPDRTDALLYGGESPVPRLLESIEILKQAGADYIACPCNTAYVFLRQLADEQGFELIDMIEETIIAIKERGIARAGLLSTSGTAASGIYQETGRRFGIEIVSATEQGISDLMEAVYGPKGIKANARYERSRRNRKLIIDVMRNFEERGFEAVIMGCTEIPLAIEARDTDLLLINPTEILARSIVMKCKGGQG
ncbi:MAG: aspartate/glutamate racemase family protein [Bacteroidales bacterium]|nr:aspartate/glutamate racemase family protein [Bacteroidales bacterium]